MHAAACISSGPEQQWQCTRVCFSNQVLGSEPVRLQMNDVSTCRGACMEALSHTSVAQEQPICMQPLCPALYTLSLQCRAKT